MTNWKYVGWDGPDGLPQVVVFPPTLKHGDMVPRGVVPRSAGFVTATAHEDDYIINSVGMIEVTFTLSGHSDSLNLSPRPADADAFALAQ